MGLFFSTAYMGSRGVHVGTSGSWWNVFVRASLTTTCMIFTAHTAPFQEFDPLSQTRYFVQMGTP